MNRLLAGIVIVCLIRGVCEAQSQYMGRLIGEPWNGIVQWESYDHPIIEPSAPVNHEPTDAKVFFWDSFGRVRFEFDNQDSPFIAYRLLTIKLGADTPLFKAQMDEMSAVLGFQLGKIADWKVGMTIGGGYSSTHPFVNSSGIFQIGHLSAIKPIDAENSFMLSLDYEGNSSYLPDTPLPGFAFLHHSDTLDFMFGFPMSSMKWTPAPKLCLRLQYQVPYTADVDLDYRLTDRFGFYGDTGNFFQGFVRSDSDIFHRQFFQMSRVETGVRLNFDPFIDFTIGIGYAFDQTISNGYDIRDMHGVGHIANAPYLSFIIRGGY